MADSAMAAVDAAELGEKPATTQEIMDTEATRRGQMNENKLRGGNNLKP